MPTPRDTIFVAKFHTRCQAFIDSDAPADHSYSRHDVPHIREAIEAQLRREGVISGHKVRCRVPIVPGDLVFIPSGRGYVQHAQHAPDWVWEKREQLDALFALVMDSEIKKHHHSVKRWASAAIDEVKAGRMLDVK